MNWTFRTGISIGLLGMTLNTPLGAYDFLYVVKTKDSLSSISRRHISGQVYGKNGAIQKILKLNPHLKDPHKIYPGQVIRLAITSEVIEEHKTINDVSYRSTATEPPDQKIKKLSYSAFEVASDFYSTKIAATDLKNGTKANIFSQSNFGLTLDYKQHWTKDFESGIFFGYRKISFAPPSSEDKSLESDENLYSFGVKAAFWINDSHKLKIFFKNETMPFLRGTSSGAVQLDTLPIFSLGTSSLYKIAEIESFSLFSELGGFISIPQDSGEYKTKWNPGFFGTIKLRERVTEFLNLETGIRAEHRWQNTDIADQSQTDLGIFMKLIVPLNKKSD